MAILLAIALLCFCVIWSIELRRPAPLFPSAPGSFETTSAARTVCLVLSILVGVAVLVLTIIWCVYLGRVASKAKETRCAVTVLLSHTLNGVKTDSATFIGVNRQVGLVDGAIQVIETSRNSAADVAAINAANLN